MLASGSADGTARVWDLASRRQHAVCATHEAAVTGVGFAEGGDLLVTCSWDGTVRFWDGRGGPKGKEVRPPWRLRDSLLGLALDAQRRTLAVAVGGYGVSNQVPLWDLERNIPLPPVGNHAMPIGGVAFDPTGRWVFSGGADCLGKLWDPLTGAHGPVMRFRGWLQGVAYSPDGQTVAIASGTTVRLFDPNTGRVRRRLRGHTRQLTSVAISPEGDLLLSAAQDGTVRAWTLPEGQPYEVFRWKEGGMHAVAFAPDGMTAAAAGTSGQIVVWDITD